jgi:hypothetical protein
MPVVSDFTTILGDDSANIGSASFEKSFDTGGRHGPGTAYIAFMVAGMTETNQNAVVEVNNDPVGHLLRNKGGNPDHWQTQMVSFSGSQLKNGTNSVRVHPVDKAGGTGNDPFQIRNVICHFHQDT